MAKTHRTQEATIEMFQHDPELAAEYLNSVLEDGDEIIHSARYGDEACSSANHRCS